MPSDIIGLDWSDVSAAFDGASKISVFSADNFEVGEISKSVKGADCMAIWVHGEKNTQLKECQSVVEAIVKDANGDANMLWAAGLQGKKQVFVLAGWKPKGNISKETLKSAVEAKVKEIGMGNFDVKKWSEETKAKLAKLPEGEGKKSEVCKECGRAKDDVFDEIFRMIMDEVKYGKK